MFLLQVNRSWPSAVVFIVTVVNKVGIITLEKLQFKKELNCLSVNGLSFVFPRKFFKVVIFKCRLKVLCVPGLLTFIDSRTAQRGANKVHQKQ